MQITTLDPLTAKTEDNSHRQSLATDFDNFLTMLTTQLQNQDPLSPMDSTEFTNQLVQFSQLEQQINQSGKLDDLIAMQQSAETAAALGYLGNEVEMISSIALLDGGEARFAYSLPSQAASTTVTIFDEDGNIVRTMAGETEAGRHDVTWDGTNDQGVQLADGAYSILVSANDENDDPLTDITVLSRGTAEEVVTESGLTYLRVGNVYVPLDRIVSVSPGQGPLG
jgi:flagellar basal-body rod modification protein FlgD